MPCLGQRGSEKRRFEFGSDCFLCCVVSVMGHYRNETIPDKIIEVNFPRTHCIFSQEMGQNILSIGRCFPLAKLLSSISETNETVNLASSQTEAKNGGAIPF